jgi:hypothetical protein
VTASPTRAAVPSGYDAAGRTPPQSGRRLHRHDEPTVNAVDVVTYNDSSPTRRSQHTQYEWLDVGPGQHELQAAGSDTARPPRGRVAWALPILEASTPNRPSGAGRVTVCTPLNCEEPV